MPELPAPAELPATTPASVLVGRYLDWIVAKGRSRWTLRGRKKDLGYVMAWLEKELGRPPEKRDLTGERLQAYLDQRKCQTTTLNTQISALRKFIRHAKIPIDLDEHLQREPEPRRHPVILSEDQAAALVEAPARPPRGHVDRLTPLIALRDRAALELFYSGGPRLSELAGLHLDELEFGLDEAGRDQVLLRIVLGKGRKDRTVPCQGPAVAALRVWLAHRKEMRPEDDLVFTSRMTRRGLSESGLREVVYLYGELLGLHVYPHLLRHCCGTHLIKAGVSEALVQELFGHASGATTKKYTHIAGTELGPLCAARHPRAKLPIKEGPLKEVLALLPLLRKEQLLVVLQMSAGLLGPVVMPP